MNDHQLLRRVLALSRHQHLSLFNRRINPPRTRARLIGYVNNAVRDYRGRVINARDRHLPHLSIDSLNRNMVSQWKRDYDRHKRRMSDRNSYMANQIRNAEWQRFLRIARGDPEGARILRERFWEQYEREHPMRNGEPRPHRKWYWEYRNASLDEDRLTRYRVRRPHVDFYVGQQHHNKSRGIALQ